MGKYIKADIDLELLHKNIKTMLQNNIYLKRTDADKIYNRTADRLIEYFLKLDDLIILGSELIKYCEENRVG